MLVVDDEPAIRLLCRVNLELEGFRVLEAATKDEARRILASDDPGVVLVDVHIAGRDGRRLVEELRARGTPRRIALLTGTFELSPDERGGADEAIEKPFTLERLVSVVRRLAGEVDSASL